MLRVLISTRSLCSLCPRSLCSLCSLCQVALLFSSVPPSHSMWLQSASPALLDVSGTHLPPPISCLPPSPCAPHARPPARLPPPPTHTPQAVHTAVLNPKSIKMGELYGEYNLLTNEWHDGLASSLIRAAVAAPPPDFQWVVLDGPVDAVWIENMNTGAWVWLGGGGAEVELWEEEGVGKCGRQACSQWCWHGGWKGG